MDSRKKILEAVARASRESAPLSDAHTRHVESRDLVQLFSETLTSIGGAAIELETIAGATEYIHQHFPESAGTLLSAVPSISLWQGPSDNPRSFDNVNAFITRAQFGVAENGAVWLTDQAMPHRVLPFIAQHLVVVVNRDHLVPSMHEAYARIGSSDYSFGTFIAGPSKTADIEQSLVLGAHGPKSMTVLLLRESVL